MSDGTDARQYRDMATAPPERDANQLAPTTVIFNVWWEEDPTNTRDVTGWCKTCAGYDGRPDDVYLVSPQGIAHHTHWEHGDRTACGHDATGPEWWWRT